MNETEQDNEFNEENEHREAQHELETDLFGNQHSLFSEEQLEEISIIIKRYSDEEIIQDAYEYFQVVGFPYPTLTLFEMKQEINKLANMELDSCLRSTIAYRVADTFSQTQISFFCDWDEGSYNFF